MAHSRRLIRRAPMSWEYIACFFDCEGSVRVSTRSRSPHPRLDMSQRNLQVLEEMKAFMGYGNIRPNGPNSNGVMRLHIEGKRNILHFTRHAEPYLRVKRRQVVWARLMAERINAGPRRTSEKTRREREFLASKIKEANSGHRV